MKTRRYTRFVRFNIIDPTAERYGRKVVVPLPLDDDPTATNSKNPKAASQVEIFDQRRTDFHPSQKLKCWTWPIIITLGLTSHQCLQDYICNRYQMLDLWLCQSLHSYRRWDVEYLPSPPLVADSSTLISTQC
jgi:hypothetical protein